MSAPGADPAGGVGLIINPRATVAHPSVRTEVARMLEPLGLEWHHTTGARGDAGAMARECVAAGARAVVALGGDGTVQEVAGALAGTSTVLAPLPAGNANVFARALGWPARMDDALGVLPGALAGERRAVHVGRVIADAEERVFVINAGVGLDAATVDWIEHRPRTKRHLRQTGFAVGLWLATMRARGAGTPLHVTLADGQELDLATVLAACGSPYTYLHGRPLDLVPGADFSGELRWTGLRRVRPGELGLLMARVASGRGLGMVSADPDAAVVMGEVGPGLVVRAEEPMPVQADGEAMGMHTEVVIRPGPRLLVALPAGA
ncbi:MAG: diacylglycerol kinase family protein [Miltoncostaeaceae bacterium]